MRASSRHLPLLFVATLVAWSPLASDTVPLVRPVVGEISGTVFEDRNANGKRDAGESGLAGVSVSDQANVVVTDAGGAYRLSTSNRSKLVFVSLPDGYRSVGPFYRETGTNTDSVDFALVPARQSEAITFLHASDTHLSAASLPRMQRLRALIDSLRPTFVLITGDLVRDALRVGEAEATSYYALFQREAAQIAIPVWTVPGNHENFGIERDTSGVSMEHPLYGRAMYHHYRGPDYYSFNAGGVHFVGLNTVDIDDTRYYGHVDSLQLAWLARDLAAIPAGMPVITFNHIPFFSAMESVHGYTERPPAPSVITVNGTPMFRHTVSNAAEVLAIVSGHPYPLALGGHIHTRELLRLEGSPTRFEQAAAIVAPNSAAGMTFRSGVTLYRLTSGAVDAGQFVPLDPAPRATGQR